MKRKYIDSVFIDDTNWKSTGIMGVVCLVLFLLLDSFLFAIAVWLLKVVLVLLAIYLLGRTAYLIYLENSKKA